MSDLRRTIATPGSHWVHVEEGGHYRVVEAHGVLMPGRRGAVFYRSTDGPSPVYIREVGNFYERFRPCPGEHIAASPQHVPGTGYQPEGTAS